MINYNIPCAVLLLRIIKYKVRNEEENEVT